MSEEKKKIVFIINPKSGTHDKGAILRWIGEELDKNQYIKEVVYTEYAGHATEIAARCAAEGVDTALGIIPCGSGNGLARHLQIPLDPRRAVDILNRGKVENIDYGKINGIPFFCTCGVGFDALVSLKFSQAGRRGPLMYLEQSLRESLQYRPEVYELEMDNNSSVHYKAFLIACGNASQYGNNAYIAPRAALDDGLLDVTILEPFTMLDVPTLAFQLFNKTIDQNSRIKTFQCKSLRIRRSKPGAAHYDGEPMMTDKDVEVKVVQKELKVIVPQHVESPLTDVIQRAQDYINGLKQLNESILDDISQRNKLILDKGKRQFKKLAKK